MKPDIPMALLLNIDTATSFASVGFSRDGIILSMKVNEAQKEHAAFLQPAIESLTRELSIGLEEVDGIALTIGPGSYTGLRVGLSSAKGIAYALDKPLIAIGTLEVMAYAAEKEWARLAIGDDEDRSPLFCPMIDARRNEVFTAIYAPGGVILREPGPMILSEYDFEPFIENNVVVFSGDGSIKWKLAYPHSAARFLLVQHSVVDLAVIAEKHFRIGDFGARAYLQPLYLKEFHKNS